MGARTGNQGKLLQKLGSVFEIFYFVQNSRRTSSCWQKAMCLPGQKRKVWFSSPPPFLFLPSVTCVQVWISGQMDLSPGINPVNILKPWGLPVPLLHMIRHRDSRAGNCKYCAKILTYWVLTREMIKCSVTFLNISIYLPIAILNRYSTVVPRITTLSRSSEITVEWKHRKAKIKKPLKRIKTWLMSSNQLRTHCPAKNLHRGGHFLVPVQRKIAPKHSGEPFWAPGGHFENPTIGCFDLREAKIGFWNREPIIAQRNSPIQNIILRLQKPRCNADSSLNRAPVLRGTTVFKDHDHSYARSFFPNWDYKRVIIWRAREACREDWGRTWPRENEKDWDGNGEFNYGRRTGEWNQGAGSCSRGGKRYLQYAGLCLLCQI